MSTSDPGKDIREQAARWVIRMTDPPDDLTDAERSAFNAWIADPLHELEFHAINTAAVMAADLPQPDRTRLTDWALNYRDPSTTSRRQVWGWTAIAASLIVALLGAGFYARYAHWFTETAFVTRTGETRTVTFDDRSVAYLNTRTDLRWIGNGEERRVKLNTGEALFEVTHDAAHPFSVVLDNSEIRVLGTRFNVYRKPNGDTKVTVIDGTIEVRGRSKTAWTRTLRANEQIEYRDIGLVREPHQTEAQETVLWRSGVYKFSNESIENVIEELNRYTDRDITISDPRVSQRRIGGALSTRDIRASLKRLEDFAPIDIKEDNGNFTLDYRADAGQGKD